MIYLVWVLLGILASIKKNNKFVTLLVALFILCVFCFNTSNIDLNNYIRQYNGSAQYFSEPIFIFLSSIFRNLGFEFEVFRFAIILVCLLLIINTIYRYSPYPTFVLYLYSIYPMTIDVIQIRFFVGYSIVLFACRFLIDYQEGKEKKNICMFFLLVIIATGCHYVCILYSLLALLFLDVGKHKFIFFIIIPILIIVMILMKNVLVPLIVPIVGAHKVNLWVTNDKTASIFNITKILTTRSLLILFPIIISFIKRNTIFSNLYSVAPSGLQVFLQNIGCKEYGEKNRYYNLNVNRTLFFSIYYISIFMVLEIFIAGDYERLARLGLVLSGILISRQLFYLSYYNRLVAFVLLPLLYVLYFVSIMYFTGASGDWIYIDFVFKQVMENNSLF